MVSEFFKRIFSSRAKRGAQRILDSFKPELIEQLDEALDRVCDMVDDAPDQAEEILRDELSRVVSRIRGLPVYALIALQVAIANVQIPDGQVGTVQQNIRKEGERIKARIRGARL